MNHVERNEKDFMRPILDDTKRVTMLDQHQVDRFDWILAALILAAVAALLITGTVLPW